MRAILTQFTDDACVQGDYHDAQLCGDVYGHSACEQRVYEHCGFYVHYAQAELLHALQLVDVLQVELLVEVRVGT